MADITKLQDSKNVISIGTFKDNSWQPKDYLYEFYNPNDIDADEIEALQFQIDFSKKNLQHNPLVLEFGSGPTAHRAIAVAPYVSEIHVAEYLPDNLEELRKWVHKDGDYHNWDLYVSYILQCEGNPHPTEEQIEQRKELTRKKITKFIQADAGDRYPLGKDFDQYYSHVYSGFCADSATEDKEIWKIYMHNIASLVAPSGTFLTAALRKTGYYAAGPNYFPSANIDEEDMRKILELDFLTESITIEIRELPEMKEHGFEGIVLAHAVKR